MVAITEVVIVFVIGLHFMFDKNYAMIDLRSRHSTDDVPLRMCHSRSHANGCFRGRFGSVGAVNEVVVGDVVMSVGWGRFGMVEPCERQSLESR